MAEVDIVERLRHKIYGTGDPGITILSDSIAEIERLRMELRHIANTFDESWVKGSVERMMGDRARKALGHDENNS